MSSHMNSVVEGVRPKLQGNTLALMLFGSMARGDSDHRSDIDILHVLGIYRPSYRVENYAISVYTVESLRKIASEGSLFILHLKSEGIVLEDPYSILEEILQVYRPPQSYEPLLQELRLAVNILNVTQQCYLERWDKWNGVALFLLRSVLFALAAEAGHATFSIERIAEINRDN